jgi:hypothetical protein
MKIALAAPTHLPARRANTIQVMKMAQALEDRPHRAPGCPGSAARKATARLGSSGLPVRVGDSLSGRLAAGRFSFRRYDYGCTQCVGSRLGRRICCTPACPRRLPWPAAPGLPVPSSKRTSCRRAGWDPGLSPVPARSQAPPPGRHHTCPGGDLHQQFGAARTRPVHSYPALPPTA